MTVELGLKELLARGRRALSTLEAQPAGTRPTSQTSCCTPSQITATLVSAHASLAVIASLLAVPLGIALYLALYAVANGTIEDAVLAPWWSLVLIPIGAVLVVVAATIVPARLATRIRATDALRSE